MIDTFLPIGIALLIIGVLSLPAFVCYRMLINRIEILELKVHLLTAAQIGNNSTEENKKMSLHEIKQVFEHNQRLLDGYTALLHERERDHAKIRDLIDELRDVPTEGNKNERH